jgi:hypothetical protein
MKASPYLSGKGTTAWKALCSTSLHPSSKGAMYRALHVKSMQANMRTVNRLQMKARTLLAR